MTAPDTPVPRRSVLYMPGANERALVKARDLPADGLILDLEDSVAPDAKAAARARVVDAARGGAYGSREVAIRANGLGTPWHDDDVAAIAASGADACLVPKVDTPADLDAVDAALRAAGAPDDLALWAMLETPSAVVHAAEIASHPRLAVLVMGANDLAKELRAELVPGRAPLLHVLQACVLGARAGGAAILDSVFNDLDDPDGFLAECEQGRSFGFDGKTLIHPRQLEPANRTWAPDEEAVEHARRVIAAFEEASAEGLGVITVDGSLVEALHVEQARRTLALHEAVTG